MEIKHANTPQNRQRALALADKYGEMTDEELSAVTDVLKGRLAEGETLDDILPEAFAAIREDAIYLDGKSLF